MAISRSTAMTRLWFPDLPRSPFTRGRGLACALASMLVFDASIAWASVAEPTESAPAAPPDAAGEGEPTLTPAPPDSPGPEPTSKYELAVRAYEAGEYERAIGLFEAAYADEPKPNYLFNIGRVYEEMGQLEAAIEYYERFLERPNVQLAARQAAVERLEVLNRVVTQLHRRDVTVSEPRPTPPAGLDPVPTAAEVRPVSESPPRGRGLVIAGGITLGLGAAALAAGGAFGGLAMARAEEARDALDPATFVDVFEDRAREAKRLAIFADVSFAAGAVVTVIGTTLLAVGLVRSRAARSTRTAWAPMFDPRSLGLTVRHHF